MPSPLNVAANFSGTLMVIGCMTKALSVFLFWAKLTLIFVFLVIIAGSVVRATGAGMGCPDWPKCFGYYIPPTELAQLEFQQGRQFEKGQFIIHHRALWKARQDFTAGASIDMADWEKYTKHDYAKFNAAHTWTEYINRLCGATLGIVAFVTFLLSLRLRRESRSLPVLSFLAVVLIGFEAWLGATVVESNLEPAKITTHMVGALVIVGVVMEMIRRAQTADFVSALAASQGLRWLVVAGFLATVVQIVIGTQVREAVDAIEKATDGQNRAVWIEQIGVEFDIHRGFAYAVLLLNGYLIYRLRAAGEHWQEVKPYALAAGALLLTEWLTGVVLALFALPAYIQPLHLVLATLIFALQIRIWQLLRPVRSSLATASPVDRIAQRQDVAKA